MKFKLAVLSAVILAGIAASAALAELAAVTSKDAKSAGASCCAMAKTNQDQTAGMSCHTDEQAAAPAKGGCCK